MGLTKKWACKHDKPFKKTFFKDNKYKCPLCGLIIEVENDESSNIL